MTRVTSTRSEPTSCCARAREPRPPENSTTCRRGREGGDAPGAIVAGARKGRVSIVLARIPEVGLAAAARPAHGIMRRDGDFLSGGMTRSLAATLAVVLGTVALLAGAVAILPALALGLFAIAFLIFTAPGWGLARFYAGGDLDRVTHAVLALFLGLLSGSILFCVMRLIHLPGPFPVLAACGLTGALAWWASRDAGEGVVSLPRLGPADHAAMGGLALLVALVVGPVFANVGRIDQGDLSYRAYFFADLFAHMSVVGELEKQTIPTVNPYLEHRGAAVLLDLLHVPDRLQHAAAGPARRSRAAADGLHGRGALHDGVVPRGARSRRIAARLGRGLGDGHRRDQLRRASPCSATCGSAAPRSGRSATTTSTR